MGSSRQSVAAVLAAACGLVLWSPARAEPTSLAAHAGVVMPLGAWGDTAGIGYGGLVSLDVAHPPAVAVRATLGLFYHPPREVNLPALGTLASNLWEVPVLLGARYLLAPLGALTPFVEGQLGAVFTRTQLRAGAQADVDTDVGLGGFVGVGGRADSFELSLAWWVPSLSEVDDAAGLFLSVGLRLAAL